MTEQQILDLGPALADYLDHFLFCCEYTQTFRHLSVYCRGLLSDLKRKTAEPIALASGTGVRTLQLFLPSTAGTIGRSATSSRSAWPTCCLNCPPTTRAPSASSTRAAMPRKATRPPACNVSIAANWARKRTVSSPSTSPLLANATRV